jgi:hypothetical protein
LFPKSMLFKWAVVFFVGYLLYQGVTNPAEAKDLLSDIWWGIQQLFEAIESARNAS